MAKKSWFETNPIKTMLLIFVIGYLVCDLVLAALLIPAFEGEVHLYYHHTFKKNHKGFHRWEAAPYPFMTNSLGFKDKEVRQVALVNDRPRYVIIGDSFVEGIGLPYEKTFVGKIDQALRPYNIDVLNAGARSYSPKLYYLKVKYLLEKTGLRFDQLIVYIDISDIQDEIVYELFEPYAFKHFLTKLDRALYWRLFSYNRIGRESIKNLYDQALSLQGVKGAPSGEISDSFYWNYYQKRPRWTIDKKLYNAWGKRGLELASANMAKLVSLCATHRIKVTIAVYPWPIQISTRDLNSIQVTFWKDFAMKHSVDFINYFPDFIYGLSPDPVIGAHFLPQDMHWNERGHKLIARRLLDNLRNDLVDKKATGLHVRRFKRKE